MKTAADLLSELQLLLGSTPIETIWLTEVIEAAAGGSNWNAGAEPMTPDDLAAFTQAVRQLRDADPWIDWNAHPLRPGVRRLMTMASAKG